MAAPGFVMLQEGAVFRGRYRVVRAIKAGGMGAVYEAADATTGARRALKVMLPGAIEDPGLRARFALEARITGDVESDHIVRVFDAGIDEATETPFLVMELLQGEDLGQKLKQGGPLPPEEALAYLGQAAMALDKTHAASIVHRDLKPDNLFVTKRDDGSSCVKILDFGIAKVVARQAETQGTQPLGTPLFMAPEQIRGKADVGAAVDLYALGHIAYALLAGEPYWAEERRSSESLFPLFQAIVAGPAEPPVARVKRLRGVELPSGFDAWFTRATAVEPEARFASATDAVAALEKALATPTARMIEVVAEVAAEGRGEWTDVGQRTRTRRMTLAVGAIVAALAVIGAAIVTRPASGPAPELAPTTQSLGQKRIEDALFKVSIEDYEGAHLLVIGIPEEQRPTDDPGLAQVETAWAKWKLEQVEKTADVKQKRAILKEIASTLTVGPQERKQAVEMLQALDAKGP
jgi:serine/threonine-protein kinase